MSRTLIPHGRDDQPVIDYFYCSECNWSQPISRPEPYELPYAEMAVICREFERHRCKRFEKRTKTDAA